MHILFIQYGLSLHVVLLMCYSVVFIGGLTDICLKFLGHEGKYRTRLDLLRGEGRHRERIEAV